MIQILVCEDDRTLEEYITEKVHHALAKEETQYTVKSYNSSKEILKDIPYFERIKTIALLDIDLEREEDGFRIAKRLRSHYGHEVIIIFMTSYSEYVFKCFDYEPLGFIRKKCLETEFDTLMGKALQKAVKQHKMLTFFKTSEGEVKIRENDIIYFEKVGRCVKIKTVNSCFEVHYQLSELQDMLEPKKFMMIYRSVVVNMEYVVRVDKDQVVLENGEPLPMSRYRMKQVKEAFQLYL